MGMNSPAEIAKNYVTIGKNKVNTPIGKMFLMAVMAGAFIAFGGIGSSTASVGVTPASVGKLISGCIFPGGLTMVLLAGSELFTGNCLLSIPLLEKEISGNADYVLTSPVELRLPGSGKGLTRHGGYGVCALTREGLTYTGTKDGEPVQLQYPLQKIYRLLFGAGENFEVYDGTEIRYFVPEERRSAVDWYMASMILYEESVRSGT